MKKSTLLKKFDKAITEYFGKNFLAFQVKELQDLIDIGASQRKINSFCKKQEREANKYFDDMAALKEEFTNFNNFKGLEIITEFSKNHQCKATITLSNCKMVESSFTAGYGYDKESQAIAEALNSSLVRFLGIAQYKKIKSIYGSNLNYNNKLNFDFKFSGGVGFSCHDEILQSLGFKKTNNLHTKTTDIYIYSIKLENDL